MKEVAASAVRPGVFTPPDDAVVTEIGAGWLWRHDGVVFLVLRDALEMTLEHAHELVAYYREIGGGKPLGVVADVGTVKRGSTEARQYLAGEESAPLHAALANIIDSPVARVLMAMFVRLQRPPFPSRAYPPEQRDEAVAWVRSVVMALDDQERG